MNGRGYESLLSLVRAVFLMASNSQTTAAPLVEHCLGSVIRGHHIYKTIWMPYTGERLGVEREGGNTNDSYAVSIIKDDLIVGHVPREMSRICWHFLGHEGTMASIVKVCNI